MSVPDYFVQRDDLQSLRMAEHVVGVVAERRRGANLRDGKEALRAALFCLNEVIKAIDNSRESSHA